jgi:DNA-directed RNA polymerase specialized sigma24 family protein
MLALSAAEKRAPDRFGSLEHARNYFLRAVRTLALKRRGNVSHAALDEEPGAAVSDAPASFDSAPAVDPAERVAALLQELTQAEREFLQQRFLEQCTLAELSARSGIAVSTLYSREKALLERLRRRARGGGET